MDDEPTYVVFDGEYQGPPGPHATDASMNDTVRFFFGNAGPNRFSAFHMVGAMFEDVRRAGNLIDPLRHNRQAVTVAPGSPPVTEQMRPRPANYHLADNSIVDAIDNGRPQRRA